jgi:hypothetical protein
MKAMEKEPGRRYRTAEALATDIERHLQGQPVAAAAPSPMVRLRQTVRRHRRSLVMAALLMVGIVFGALALDLWRTRTPAVAAPVIPSGTVEVKYGGGGSEFVTINPSVKLFTNRNYLLDGFPPELAGLNFTRRMGGEPADLTIDAASGTTVYLLLDSEIGPNASPQLNGTLATTGWTRLADAYYLASDNSERPIAIYKQNFVSQREQTFHVGGWSGLIVAARNLALPP